MKITGCKFFLIETPRETGAISEHLMIRIDTDEGVSGWGEWSDLAHSHPAEFPNFDLVEEEANHRIAGADPLNIGETMERLGGLIPEAFDVGLYDLMGKILDVPVYSLLGGQAAGPHPLLLPDIPDADADWGEDPGQEIEDNVRRVRRVEQMGQHRIRKYIGYNLDAEEQWLRTFRDTFGAEMAIKSLDLSGRFHWQEALRLLQRFKEYDYEVAESVSRRKPGQDGLTDVEGMAEVRRQLGVPISEHLNDYASILRYRDAGAVDVANIATCQNGIKKTKELFEFTAGIGLRALHGTTQELSIGTSAAAHVMASLETVDMPCDQAGPLLYTEDCTSERVKYEDSCLVVPEGPGLGITVDEDHLEEIAYKGTRLALLRAGGPSGH